MPLITAAGVQTYYEDHGGGDPVVLLHGGLESGVDWAPYVEPLRATYRVLVPDCRGLGRTLDGDGRCTYEAMAGETVAFLDQVAGAPARLVSYSDGGNVALLVARDRPDLVHSLVTIGSSYHADGLVPQFVARLRNPHPDSPCLAPIRDASAATSPDGPEHWPTLYRKVADMGHAGPTITVDDLADIACPVLVVAAADDDVVTLDHAMAMFDALRHGQLAVVPGTSHLVHHERPDLLTTLIEEFLADPTRAPLMPMRRS